MNLVRTFVRSGEYDSLKMNATVMRVVPLQFTVPLLILGNLNGNEVTPDRLHYTPVSSQGPVTLPANYTAFPELGSAYKFVESNLTWHDARRHCVSEGGNLAVFDSQQKLDVGATLGYSDFYNAWSGVHNFYSSNDWISVKDGSRVTFFSWYSDWPKVIENKPCVGVHYDGERKMTHWNGVCWESYYFFCEIPIQKPWTALS